MDRFKTYLLLIICVFGSLYATSQNCYVVSRSYTGLAAFEVSADLEAKACELSQLISGFKVYSYDFYPVLAYVDRNIGFDIMMENVIEEHASEDRYLIIAREYFGDTKTFAYRIELKLPAGFNNYSEMDRLAIQNRVLNDLNSKVAEGEYLVAKAPFMERDALDLLLGLLNGTQSISNTFSLNGFEAIEITEAIPGLNFTGQENVADPLFKDYAGVHLKDGANDIALLNKLVELSPTLFSIGVVITANLPSIDFDNVHSDFENMNSKVKIWIHFDINNPNSESDSIFFKAVNEFTYEEAVQILGDRYQEHMDQWIEKDLPPDGPGPTARSTGDCSISFMWGYKCIVIGGLGSSSQVPEFGLGLAAGLLDGLLGTIEFAYNMVGGGVSFFGKIYNSITEYVESLYNYYIVEQSFIKVLEKVRDDFSSVLKKFKNDIIDTYNALKSFVEGVDAIKVATQAYEAILEWMGETFSSGINSGYFVGVLAFDAIVAFFSGGTSVYKDAAKDFLPKILDFVRELSMPSNMKSKVKNLLTGAENAAHSAAKAFRCKILGKGCFVKDTPVLMAGSANQFSFGNSSKVLAVAAAMPIVVVPIQEVQLLDYAVAHETVNNYEQRIDDNLIAVSDDVYLGLLDIKDPDRSVGKDPYTSDQQRERDQYELDDENWNEVVFEEVSGGSTAKLALHTDWIHQKGYKTDAMVELDLPEQGISGPFRITSIKHIIPQKKPVDEDETDEFAYKPVTALFTHESNQVYNIRFDNGDSLGVTYQHPIYSTTAGDWRFAGELEIGEEVLTKLGNTKVVSSSKKEGSETVYNLEVKELHNFLVGESGVLVHNSCWKTIDKVLDKTKTTISSRNEVVRKGWDDGIDWNPIDGGRAIGYFGRGRFFEGLLWKGKYRKDGYKYTGLDDLGEGLGVQNYPTVDVYKGNTAVSIKTTRNSNPWSWRDATSSNGKPYNTDHLDAIINGMDQGPNIKGKFGSDPALHSVEKFQLDIYVREFDTQFSTQSQWQQMVDEYLVSKSQQDLVGKIKVNLAKVENSLVIE